MKNKTKLIRTFFPRGAFFLYQTPRNPLCVIFSPFLVSQAIKRETSLAATRTKAKMKRKEKKRR
nr:MAG TPA: hypothetical protein [Caudoviricetes sp.]